MTITGGYAQAGSYPAAVDRLIRGSSLASGSAVDLSRRVGVFLSGAALAVTAPGGMTVRVGVGQALVSGGYVVENDAAYTLAVVAAGATARTDLVIARMYDAEAGDGSTGPTIEIIKGTTTAVPATPARALALASVVVGANVSSITGGNLTDLRVFTAAAGGAVPIPGAIATPALAAGLPDGTPVWDSAVNRLAVKYGAVVSAVSQPFTVGPWVDLVLSSGSSQLGGASPRAQARIFGTEFQVKGWLTTASLVGAAFQIASMPAGMVPLERSVWVSMAATTGASLARLDFKADGTIFANIITGTATTVFMDGIHLQAS